MTGQASCPCAGRADSEPARAAAIASVCAGSLMIEISRHDAETGAEPGAILTTLSATGASRPTPMSTKGGGPHHALCFSRHE